MEVLQLVLLLLLAVAISRVASRLFSLPLPILQIAIGAVIALPPFGVNIKLEPELFMVLFIAPMLFMDGFRLPSHAFKVHGKHILATSLFLVLITVGLIGYFIHWLIPEIPLAACFALAAVLSPTDALAVIAIAQGRLPRNMAHQLEGEAIMNDASGIVSFKIALAAAVTGAFSLSSAAGEFVLVAAGGLAVGAGMSWAFGMFKRRMTAYSLYDPATFVVSILLLPFAAFTVAEHLGLSGILSAVAAGMIQSRVDMLPVKTTTRILNRSLWEILDFSLNGIVFIILGSQLPGILEHVWSGQAAGGISVPMLAFYSLALLVGLLAIRFGFLYGYYYIEAAIKRREGKAESDIPRWLVSALMSVAGVRGAITLAGVLSVPLMLGGEAFGARDLMIFLAAAVIIMSLLLGTVAVPYLLKFLPNDESHKHDRHLQKAREKMFTAALKWLEAEAVNLAVTVEQSSGTAPEKVAVARVVDEYRHRLERIDEDGSISADVMSVVKLEGDAKLGAIKAQRTELMRMRRKDEIDDELLQELIQELDYAEASLA